MKVYCRTCCATPPPRRCWEQQWHPARKWDTTTIWSDDASKKVWYFLQPLLRLVGIGVLARKWNDTTIWSDGTSKKVWYLLQALLRWVDAGSSSDIRQENRTTPHHHLIRWHFREGLVLASGTPPLIRYRYLLGCCSDIRLDNGTTPPSYQMTLPRRSGTCFGHTSEE